MWPISGQNGSSDVITKFLIDQGITFWNKYILWCIIKKQIIKTENSEKDCVLRKRTKFLFHLDFHKSDVFGSDEKCVSGCCQLPLTSVNNTYQLWLNILNP